MNKMEQKNSLNKLLSDIQELEYLVRELLNQDTLSIQTLSFSGNKASIILDNIKAIEKEEIQSMKNKLTEQQAELNNLSVLLSQYQQMADTCRKKIIIQKEEVKEAETLLVEKPLEPEYNPVSEESLPRETPETNNLNQPKDFESEAPNDAFRLHDTEPKQNTEAPIEHPVINQNTQESVIKEITVPSKPEIIAEHINAVEKTQEHNLSGIAKNNISLNDILEKKNLSDFRKAFSLNDRFRFRRDLFHNNENQMNQVISDLNQIGSLDQAIEYINQNLSWDMNSEPVVDFMKLLEKRYI